MFDTPIYLAKIIGQLPDTLEPNAIYFVRKGYGVDLYVTDATGQIAHSLNPSFINTIYSGFPPTPTGSGFVVPYAVGATAGTILTLTPNRIYWIPFVNTSLVRITGLSINVTTASAGTHYVGIYSADVVGKPVSLLARASFATNTTGVKSVTLPSPLDITPGVYWMAWASGSAATVRAIALAACRSLGLPSLGTANTTCWYTSGNVLPDLPPSTGYTALNGSALPAVGVNYALLFW